jgi:hypothetical protein
MSKTNCPNCGAAKDASEIKCPFCGTAYLDMTAIDLYKHEPIWLKFVGPDGSVYQIKAYPTVASFTIEPETMEIYSVDGFRRRLHTRNDIRISLEFAGTEEVG